MVGIALSWGCVKSMRNNGTEKGRCRDLTIGSLLKYRPRKRETETTPRTAAVRNDSFRVKSSGMLENSLSSGSLDEREARVPSSVRVVRDRTLVTKLRLTHGQYSSRRLQLNSDTTSNHSYTAKSIMSHGTCGTASGEPVRRSLSMDTLQRPYYARFLAPLQW
jgi:hypothetical protein